jgi:hypothetical protein
MLILQVTGNFFLGNISNATLQEKVGEKPGIK